MLKPVAIIGGTFLLWIAARGRFQQYANLMYKGSGGVTTPGSATVTGVPSPAPVAAVANTIHALAANAWEAFKPAPDISNG